MRTLKSEELIAYASAFTSFMLTKIEILDIILFGSVARGEATSESDIDLFINVKNNENKIKKVIDKELNKFYKSKIAEMWVLKGVKNQIKIHVGDIDKWGLKRSIISDGIILYGKYEKIPQGMRGFVYFKLNSFKNITKRNFILRKLFGRLEKSYSSEGMVKKYNGKKLSSLSFIIPINHIQRIMEFLNSQKTDYDFFEFWSDQIR